jgi:stage V sporulation protein G
MADEKEKSDFFDILAVTQVLVFPFGDGNPVGHIKGLATVVLNDQFMVRGLRIMEGECGLFVGYPIDPFFRGEGMRSVCTPVTRQLRENIEGAVLAKFREATGETGEEG